MIYELELDWMHRLLDAIRTPFWNKFFIFWNYFDSLPFGLVVIGIVWYLINRQIGIRLFYVMMLSSIVNELLKYLFDLPRPCQMDPSLGLLCLKTPGFPSGAAQMGMVYAGVLILECKQRIWQLLGVLFALFLCFSRIYLGVHFFTDILGGLFVGGLLLLVYAKVFPLAAPYYRLLSFLLPITALAFGKITQFGLLLGIALGLLIDDQKPVKQWSFRILGLILAIVGTFLIFEAKTFVPHVKFLFPIAAGFWFSTVESWCRRTS